MRIFLAIILTSMQMASASAERLFVATDRQKAILRLVGNAEGYVDEGLHKEFWSEFPRNVVDDGIVNFVRDERVALHKFQYAVWASVFESARSKKPVKHSTFDGAAEKLVSSIQSFREKQRAIAQIEQSVEMIRAAAYGEAVKIDGQSVIFDESAALDVLGGMDGALDRIEALFDRRWPPQPKTYVYQRVGVEFHVPFAPKQYAQIYQNGTAREFYFNHNFHEKCNVIVYQTEDGVLSPTELQGLMGPDDTAYGAVESEAWRGEPAYALAFKEADGDGTGYGFQRGMTIPGHQSAVTLGCRAPTPARARQLVALLDGLIRFLPPVAGTANR